MSLHPDPIGPVPAEAARVAHTIFKRKGNRYVRLRDELGTLYIPSHCCRSQLCGHHDGE